MVKKKKCMKRSEEKEKDYSSNGQSSEPDIFINSNTVPFILIIFLTFSIECNEIKEKESLNISAEWHAALFICCYDCCAQSFHWAHCSVMTKKKFIRFEKECERERKMEWNELSSFLLSTEWFDGTSLRMWIDAKHITNATIVMRFDVVNLNVDENEIESERTQSSWNTHVLMAYHAPDTLEYSHRQHISALFVLSFVVSPRFRPVVWLFDLNLNREYCTDVCYVPCLDMLTWN